MLDPGGAGAAGAAGAASGAGSAGTQAASGDAGGEAAGAEPIGQPDGSGIGAMVTAVSARTGQSQGGAEEEGGETVGEEAGEADAGGAGEEADVQRHGAGGADDAGVHQRAAAGVAGAGGELPHRERIEASFGMDLAGVSSHVGGRAADAASSIGAEAYAMGSHVAFAQSPDLHLAAHEAAHVVQQRQGVSLSGGVGQEGDAYEQHADAVADRVVAGDSAADLLGHVGGGSHAVQRHAGETEVDGGGSHAVQRHTGAVVQRFRFGRRRRPQDRASIARGLIKIVGSADAADGALVAAELAKFPLAALQQLQRQRTKVAVCRGSVTEYLTALRGVRPRGWPPGVTWDTVPGLNNIATNEVVVAVIGHGTTGGAHVPVSGEGHGSFNLTLHETGHAHDLNRGRRSTRRSADPDFLAARTADLATLNAYERQAGNAGEEETYAESLARFYGGDPTDAATHPNLHRYWQDHPMGR